MPRHPRHRPRRAARLSRGIRRAATSSHDVVSGNSITPGQAAQAKSAGRPRALHHRRAAGPLLQDGRRASPRHGRRRRAMLKSLNDPWTEYMSPSQTTPAQGATSGHLLGHRRRAREEGRPSCCVTEVFDGSPAKAAGLQPATDRIGRRPADQRPVGRRGIAHIKGAKRHQGDARRARRRQGRRFAS